MGTVSSQISSSQFATGALTLTVASGQPIRVQGIMLSTGTAAAQTEFTITDNDDTTLFVVPLLTDTTVFLDVETHYNNGLKVVTDKVASSAAVFHTSPGN